MRGDELGDFRGDDFAPAAAGEDAVVAGAGGDEIVLHGGGDAGAQFVGGLGLAGAGDVVEFAFDGEQGNVGDVLWTHQFAADFPGAAGQIEVLEHGLDGFQIVL